MEAADLISLALTGVKYLTQAIEDANAGDLVSAQANLTAARDHYARASAAWEAAGQEKAPGVSTEG